MYRNLAAFSYAISALFAAARSMLQDCPVRDSARCTVLDAESAAEAFARALFAACVISFVVFIFFPVVVVGLFALLSLYT